MAIGATLSNLKEILKINYGKYFENQLNNRAEIRRRLQKGPPTRKFTGSFIRENVVTARNSTGGWYGPSAVLPTAGVTRSRLTDIYLTYSWWTISIDKDLASQSQSDLNAFVPALTLEVEMVKDFAMVEYERVACGDGTAKLANIDESFSAIVVGDGVAVPWSIRVDLYDAVRMNEGERLEFWSTTAGEITNASVKRTNPVENDWYTIGSISRNADGSATVSGELPEILDASVVDTDAAVKDEALVRTNLGAGTFTYSREEMGLKGIINSGGAALQTATTETPATQGTFQNIDPTVEGSWRSSVIDGNGGDFSPQILEDAFTDVTIFGNRASDSIKFIGTHPIQLAIWRKNKYPEERVNLGTGGTMGTFPSGMPSSKGEKTFLTYSGIPLIPSRFFDKDKAFGVNDYARYFVLQSFQTWDDDGQMWHKAFDRRTAVEAEFYCFEQMGCTNRNSMFQVNDLSTTL